MGCGGSKDEVATGNTVSINRLLRRKSSTIMSLSSPSATDRQISLDTGSGSNVEREHGAPKSDDADQPKDKSAAAKTVEEEKVTPPELSSQSSSSDKEEENTEIKDVSDDGAAKESVGVSSKEKDEEKECSSKDIEDDGESIGKNSVDFKEAICIDELESEATISVKETSKE